MPSTTITDIVLDQWIDLGANRCRSISATALSEGPEPPPPVEEEDMPLNHAIYDSGRDVIFAVRGGYVYKLNATSGVKISSARVACPDFDDAYICLDPVTDHLFVTSWMTFADQNENVTASRFVKKLVKVQPDTLAVVSTTNLPTLFFNNLDLFESGPRQLIALNNLLYGVYFDASATTDGTIWTFDPAAPGWNASNSFNTGGTYYRTFVYDPDLSLLWVPDIFGATSYDLALNAAATVNFSANRVARAVAYRSTGAKLYFTMTKQGATTPRHVLVIDTAGAGEGLIDTGRANALPFNIRYRASTDRIYVPTWQDDTVVIIDPTTDTVESVKTGFDSPFDVVFTGSKAWAVQHGNIGLKEIV